jgi:hypothetical protein
LKNDSLRWSDHVQSDYALVRKNGLIQVKRTKNKDKGKLKITFSRTNKKKITCRLDRIERQKRIPAVDSETTL